MTKTILTCIISLGLTTAAYTDSRIHQKQPSNIKPIKEYEIKKMDKQLTKYKAVKRNFRTKKEFQHKKRTKKTNKQMTSKHIYYDRGYLSDTSRYNKLYRPVKQQAYSHPKRGWTLAYRYDRASFYDNNGYYYGYFNRYGYYFEGIFYRYDRYYTYNDRVNGRGLFSHRYYMPANNRYYGLCKSR